MNAPINDPLILPMVSGFGKYATDRDGATPEALTTINFYEVRDLVDKPQQGVEKDNAQWLIPSTHRSRKGHDQNGLRPLLWADVDAPAMTIQQTGDQLSDLLGGADFEVYASSSATAEKQKCRILVPLAQALTPDQWLIVSEVFRVKLAERGIETDPASEKLGQVLYLPNKGQFYDACSSCNGALFQPLEGWRGELLLRQQEIERQAAEARRALEAARTRREALQASRSTSGFRSPIEAFNAAYDVSEVLTRNGYDQRGDSFRHPASATGSYSATVRTAADGVRRVHSLSTSDPLHTDGAGAHDAFSAFCVLEHNGDRDAALRDAGDNWLTIGGESWNKVQRREWKQQQQAIGGGLPSSVKVQAMTYTDPQTGEIRPASIETTFPDLADQAPTPDPLALLEGFALNGQSQAMRAKMLDDVHILGQMALMGQITAFFTERNGGKTLLTLWLLIDSIKRGVIQPEDVFYINSDDTHKGLVEKIEFAERWGFRMVADGYNGFKNEVLTDVMRGLCETGQARGKVFILDTLKKFTDVMKIEKGTAFMKDLRAFVLQGGSVILLGHVNKHRGDDGKLVYKGTTDVVDDCDCYYIMDKVQRQDRTIVTFENGKARGDVVMKASYSFHRRSEGGQSYADLLDTVQAADENDVAAARVEEERAAFTANNRNIVEAITEAIQAGKVLRTELVNAAHDASGESKKKVITVLDTLTGADYWGQGHRWQVSKGQTSGKVYSLLPALLNGRDMNEPLGGQESFSASDAREGGVSKTWKT